ncbi:cadherin 74A isoform X2 [Tachypleus tridentatus]
MSKFSLQEDTPVGSSIYTLRGRDPENTQVYYYISGDSFSVDKITGIVRLVRPLDREKENAVDVIISLTDEKVQGQDPNTISIKREITILDQNDNAPVFRNVPYAFFVDETVPVGTTVYKGILVTDADLGLNADVRITCMEDITPLSCMKFEVKGISIGDGKYRGEVILKETLNYEERSTYTLALKAEDLSVWGRLNSTVNAVVEVQDIQDQPPEFQNAPYSATVVESSPPGTSILTITAKDGDTGKPRSLTLSIVGDEKGYFQLKNVKDKNRDVFSAHLVTSNNPIDRENPDILNNGGLYVFAVKATEVVVDGPTGESVMTNVTVVISDINDEIPVFNVKDVNITISEDISNNTPLAGLNMVVTDNDVGDNAKFSLQLQDVQNSEGVFSVFPTVAVGRTPVIIRIADSSKLDYEQPDRHIFIFNVVAIQGGQSVSTASVTVTLSDANDNSPVFENEQYLFRVPENASPEMEIFTLQAHDSDSGSFGELNYTLKGFGSNKFLVDQFTGKIMIAPCDQDVCLDYETQPSYSLTFEAEDGGGKVSSVNLFIEVIDVNDNLPEFIQKEYSREIEENSLEISPPLVIKATDRDGPSQGGGIVKYSIKTNYLSVKEALAIDLTTGEVKLQKPIKLSDTPQNSGLFSIVVEATDGGSPPLSAEIVVAFKLRKENYGAPVFIDEPYSALVKENAREGTSVFHVKATDPDGPDADITYFLEAGAKDNFVLDKETGVISVAKGSDLDRDVYGNSYQIIILAVDTGHPIPQTATSTVSITVEDVNNKPPKFIQDSYVQYIPESLQVGEKVIKVSAHDPDMNSKLRYSIVEPITARDKTGAIVTSSLSDHYKTAFRINGTTGEIMVNMPLDYNLVSVIILTIQAVDLNAVNAASGKLQSSTVEVTIYIQAHSYVNPVFAPPWAPSNPKIVVSVPEEAAVGSTLLTLTARDPLTHKSVSHFQKVSESDVHNYVSVSPFSGAVTLNRRLDFEELPLRHIRFDAKALSGEGHNVRSSVATVVVNVQDINDNSPIFSQDSYTTSVSESIRYPETLLTVLASDKDTENSYRTIRYSLSGDGSSVFTIDQVSGNIQVREGIELDRENQSVYNLQVTATDNPEEGSNQRRTSVLVIINLVDENDNPPMFSQLVYTTVVPENVPTDFSVATVQAKDPDLGKNGEVTYSIVKDSPMTTARYFSINSDTGTVKVTEPLAGKGRSEPYTLVIRATDKGNPPQYSDVNLLVVVGDVSTNDGVPQFIKPAAGEVAYVYENATVGTSVFKVVAIDPDNPSTSNGKVAYKFLDEQQNREDGEFEFLLDAATGIITTRRPLDRETKENFTMIVVAHDLGFPPQEAHRVLRIFILDVDDNDPHFNRPVNSEPVEMKIKEEVPLDTVVGSVKALDEDVGRNAIIYYYFSYGHENQAFGIRTIANNTGEIFTKKRIDREEKDQYSLTVKVGKASPSSVQHISKPYDPNDLTEIQIYINIIDIDDNSPVFKKANNVLGIRVNTEVDTQLLTLSATDPDITSGLITYSITNTTFYRPSTQEKIRTSEIFDMDPRSGVLSSRQAFGQYVSGYFVIIVEARSSPGSKNVAYAEIKIYVLHDRDLLKFVFYKRPNEVQNIIPSLQKDLRVALAQPVSLNVYDTQFHSRGDGSLDFESTSSCFQLLEDNAILDPEKVLRILDRKTSSIEALYKNYSITAVEHCLPGKGPYKMTWSEVFVLIIASLICVVAFLVAVLVCCMYARYKKIVRKAQYYNQISVPVQGVPESVLSPAEQQRIYEWQEMNTPMADTASFRSYPILH